MRERKHIYRPGDPWLICDECGLKYRRSEMLKRWDGFMVCKNDHEPRHPQEFMRGKKDTIAFRDSRPDYDPQVGANVLGTPVNTVSATVNGDGSYTIPGTVESGILQWRTSEIGKRWRMELLVENYVTGIAVYSFATDADMDTVSWNGSYLLEESITAISPTITITFSDYFQGKVTPGLRIVTTQNIFISADSRKFVDPYGDVFLTP